MQGSVIDTVVPALPSFKSSESTNSSGSNNTFPTSLPSSSGRSLPLPIKVVTSRFNVIFPRLRINLAVGQFIQLCFLSALLTCIRCLVYTQY